MTENVCAQGVWVKERFLPFPNSISPMARASLAAHVTADGQRIGSLGYPPANELMAWKLTQDLAETDMVNRFSRGQRTSIAERVAIDGVPVYVIKPERLSPERDDRIYIEIHGGGLFFGGGTACKVFGQMTAERFNVRVHAVDYRMPPHRPYPAALDDCLAVYKDALRQVGPDNIVVGGGSAGGNLAAALMLRARDEGLSLPAALLLQTPEVDLTESGDSFEVNRGADVTLGSLLDLNKIYAAGEDLAHPYLSPLFGDFTKGFPPTLIQCGTRDLFLSNAARLHQQLFKAGVVTELHVYEARPHSGFGGAPEDEELQIALDRFLKAHWSRQTDDGSPPAQR